MDRSPSSVSISRNHSSSALENGDSNHRVRSFNVLRGFLPNVCASSNVLLRSLYQGNTHFMRKIPAGAEASNILVGEVDFLDKTLSAFIRLSQAGIMGDLTEVPVPTRFIFVLLGPRVRSLSFIVHYRTIHFGELCFEECSFSLHGREGFLVSTR